MANSKGRSAKIAAQMAKIRAMEESIESHKADEMARVQKIADAAGFFEQDADDELIRKSFKQLVKDAKQAEKEARRAEKQPGNASSSLQSVV